MKHIGAITLCILMGGIWTGRAPAGAVGGPAFLAGALAPMAWGRGQSLEGYSLSSDIPHAGTDNPLQTLDMAIPDAPSNQPFPVLLYIHGGGWQRGSKDKGLSRMANYLNGRIAGISIGYRLSGEAQWPAQLHDCKAAIRWVRAHAKEYNFSPDKIAVAGVSAGGHLASMVGLTGDVPELEGRVGPHTNESSKVTCVINFFGPCELLTLGKTPGMEHDAPDSPEAKLFGGPMQEKRDVVRAASPITYVKPGSLPFLIVHGDRDRLIPFRQSALLDRKLTEAGASSTLIKMIGGYHGFRSEVLDERIRLFLRRHLFDEDVPEISEAPIDLKAGR